jgi:hypothetical protein
MRSRRSRVSAASSREEMSVSPTYAWPPVAVSRPASTCSRVDLPEPDGPMMAVNTPCGNPTDTWSRAVTAVSPLP